MAREYVCDTDGVDEAGCVEGRGGAFVYRLMDSFPRGERRNSVRTPSSEGDQRRKHAIPSAELYSILSTDDTDEVFIPS